MSRCLELASAALGSTFPNPVVGSVIVHNGRIIGEGYHRKAGEAHAEVAAIESVTDRSLLGESTLYVNLEPCSHHGRTPPCADRIIAEGIRRVVCGTTDTSSKVAGRGFDKLRSAGCEVITGVLERESRAANCRFFTFHEKGRPRVILKWAMSADGFIDTDRPPGSPVEPYWITGLTERIFVHRWRATEQVIVAGGGTVRSDNPSLNVRYCDGRDPVKAILSRSGRLDPGSRIFGGERVLLFTKAKGVTYPGTEVVALRRPESEVVEEMLQDLFQRGFQSVFVEGGKQVLDMFIASGCWDEARVFRGLRDWGKGLPAPETGRVPSTVEMFEESILEIVYNEHIR
ncbi:MAG: bifunctional diaminohydroxyphosphoribosylaminopyrimidine deaminase/5-amino-6-(5-phosphoribosylamino)uracil reductase RibD [Bacteroidetes bacterium]|nr:bifunctional diaminohydroxyphosphoribosylaminopyrimidine deaminase/5-amino-6-(5-phosphoribosylamino)uracil reductase RibD [Bacteroidota bacterium]